MNNTERRDNQMLYTVDEQVLEHLLVVRKLNQELNLVDRSDVDKINELRKKLLPNTTNLTLNPPFFCDYGYNIYIGENSVINYNCTILDVAKVYIGKHFLAGPNVSIYTSGHPIHPIVRNTSFHYGIPVIIGDNVWIGGNTVVCPGVHIGHNCVIGAGSVVTHDIPDWSVAAGNPCRVIRSVTAEDKCYYFKDRLIDDELKSLLGI